uniref:Uncharacterized protein n=1 Tax=Amazona collaria TaxID=241587 RepID=A0A8B9FSY4_9PSIT
MGCQLGRSVGRTLDEAVLRDEEAGGTEPQQHQHLQQPEPAGSERQGRGGPSSARPPLCTPYPLWSRARQPALERTLSSRAACARWKQAVPKQTRYTAEEPTSCSQSVPPGRSGFASAPPGLPLSHARGCERFCGRS